MRPKHRMQHVRFHTVEELLDFLPEDQLEVMVSLREIVLGTIPGVAEHLAYQVPYYRRHANICFMWPGAVPWGNKTCAGVRFGFTNGYLLVDDFGFLEKGGRRQVYWRDYLRPGDIHRDLLEAFLAQAVEVDDEVYRQKLLKKQRR